MGFARALQLYRIKRGISYHQSSSVAVYLEGFLCDVFLSPTSGFRMGASSELSRSIAQPPVAMKPTEARLSQRFAFSSY